MIKLWKKINGLEMAHSEALHIAIKILPIFDVFL